MAQATSTTGRECRSTPEWRRAGRAGADAVITPAARLRTQSALQSKNIAGKEIQVTPLQSWDVQCGCLGKVPGVHRDLDKASQEISRLIAANGVFVTFLPANPG